MPTTIAPHDLHALLQGHTPFALLDVREAGEYNSTHIPGACWLPRRRLEFQVRDAVPFPGVPVVLCDDDGRRATLAAATVEAMGYGNTAILAGGINAWVNAGLPTEWGMNVPSKDFGERVEIERDVAEISADDLYARLDAGEPTVILDSRTPEEYQRFAIPGGRSVPGGELALRITDIAQESDPDAAIVVNCAGRTRSIIGARTLQRMGVPNVYALTNGTAGWTLAGYELERGADRVGLPAPSLAGLRSAEAYADRDRQALAAAAGHPTAGGAPGSDATAGHTYASRPRRPHAHPGRRRSPGRAIARSQARDPVRRPRRHRGGSGAR